MNNFTLQIDIRSIRDISTYAISGAMGNSGISVDEFVYRTLYVKYMQTFCRTWELQIDEIMKIRKIVLKANLKFMFNSRNFTEIDFIRLILSKLSRSREHSYDGNWKSDYQ